MQHVLSRLPDEQRLVLADRAGRDRAGRSPILTYADRHGDQRGGHRCGFVGHDGGSAGRGEHRHDAVVTPIRAGRRDQRDATSTPTTCRRSRCPRRLRAHQPTWPRPSRCADVLVMAVPSHGYREVAAEAAPYLRPWVPIVSLAKGVERSSLKRMSEVTADEMPGHPVAVLTGSEPGQGDPRRPAGGERRRDRRRRRSRASCSASSAARACASTPTPMSSAARSGGVVKNIIAIAAGMAEGMGFGDNTRATLITRGLAEMTRLGTAMGGQAGHVRRTGRHRRSRRHLLVQAEPQQHGRARSSAPAARSPRSSPG